MTKIRDLNFLATKKTKIIAIITITVLTLAYVSSFNPKQEAAAVALNACEPAGTVKVPLEVNVRTVANMFKTVIVEKELFNCNFVDDATDSTNPDTVREVTIVIESFEDSTGNLINSLRKVEVIQCNKSLTKLQTICTFLTPTISDDFGVAFADIVVGGDLTRVGSCSSAQLDDPIAMDSATLDSSVKIQGKLLTSSTVKTVLVEKEILSCLAAPSAGGPPVNRIFDYFTIEDIVHQLTPTPVRNTHYGFVICEKHPTFATVIECFVNLPH